MEPVMTIANDLSTAFSEFSRCIEFVGPQKTLTALRNLRYRESNVNDETVSFVLEAVTNRLSITIDELLTSRKWSLVRIVAIGMCTYIFSRHFDYSASKIGLILKKDKSTCWHNMNAFLNLSENNEEEKRLLEHFKTIESNVLLYIKNK